MTRYQVMQLEFMPSVLKKYIENSYQHLSRKNDDVYYFLHREDDFNEYDAASILSDSFTWRYSPEGDSYWRKLYIDLGGEDGSDEDYSEDFDEDDES